jgi:hypothetical protein
VDYIVGGGNWDRFVRKVGERAVMAPDGAVDNDLRDLDGHVAGSWLVAK